jgi:hypothetical protein
MDRMRLDERSKRSTGRYKKKTGSPDRYEQNAQVVLDLRSCASCPSMFQPLLPV